MNLSLTPELEALVQKHLATGRYASAEELVSEAVRRLDEEGAGAAARPFPSLPELRRKLETLEPRLRARGVTSLSVFGSIVHDKAGPESDIDILVTIDPETPFSLVDLVALKDDLEQQLGHPVDLATTESLDPALRDQIHANSIQLALDKAHE